MNDVSWGQGIPSAEGRKEVLKCQKKMGPLQYSKLWMAGVKYTTDPEFGWGGFIDDGPPQLNGEDDFDFDPEVGVALALGVIFGRYPTEQPSWEFAICGRRGGHERGPR